MDANQDILQSRWPELKGQAQQHWDKLTADDMQQFRLCRKITFSFCLNCDAVQLDSSTAARPDVA